MTVEGGGNRLSGGGGLFENVFLLFSGHRAVAESFVKDFKRFFIRGLAAVLPTVLTLGIIVWVFSKIHQYAGRYINIAVFWIIEQIWTFSASPASIADKIALKESINDFAGIWFTYFWWVGFFLAIVAIYILGRFFASFIGRSMWRIVEKTFFRFPVVRQVYPYVKQITDFLLSERRMEFSRVVAVEYPRKGIWSLGLVTGQGMKTLQGKFSSELLTIFVPSSPTPFTGYTITVSRDEIIDLPISIDEALRFVISGGVIMPLGQQHKEIGSKQAFHGILPQQTGSKETDE